MMGRLPTGALLLALLGTLAGCGQGRGIERVEWPTMGTVAAVQMRGGSGGNLLPHARYVARIAFARIEERLNAHDGDSEISRLAKCPEREALERCDPVTRPCYAAAFELARASGGAFNPRWRGADTLDFGAIAKGFAVDVAAQWMRSELREGAYLLDLGGNLRSVGGTWRTGVKEPLGEGFAAFVRLGDGEALATSATYYRGSHIYDGRTNRPVTNGVASVTVLHPTSAMLADGLSTTLFVLGPEEGRAFIERHNPEAAALWILEDGRQVRRDEKGRFLDQ